MGKQLMIIEVSQKQAYIFSSQGSHENRKRSYEIARVTSQAFFQAVCPDGYYPEENMVYTGGGHAVLQFPDKPSADTFARALTLRVLEKYPEMELFVKQSEYREDWTPGENLLALSQALEKKKALRSASFYMKRLGVEADRNYTSPNQRITSDDGDYWVIVHIDGNAMGARVAKVYEQSGNDWNLCRKNLQRFSACIDQDFSAAYDAMSEDLRQNTPANQPLPLHRILAAGDDLCFIVSAPHALECAASFLRHLSKRKNSVDGEYYGACAGIAFVDKAIPFRQGYALSEALCANAKRLAAAYGPDVSALDFQIVRGFAKPSLQDYRLEYQAEDGSQLLLRPFAVTGAVPYNRSYQYLTDTIRKMQKHRSAYTALSNNRRAFFQGQQEVLLALSLDRAQAATKKMLADNPGNSGLYFADEDGSLRCSIFDALEISGTTTLWKGAPDA